MDLIDAWSVVANTLWVLGLALVLAALSWAHWAASREEIGLRSALGRASLRIGIDLGLVLFCAGLAATSQRWWERILWGALALAWAVQGAMALSASR